MELFSWLVNDMGYQINIQNKIIVNQLYRGHHLKENFSQDLESDPEIED